MILKETILSAFNERGTLLKWLKTVERLITERALVKPVNKPQSTEIVAVDSTGEQVTLEVGTGLTIDNGVLNAVGGGSSGSGGSGGTQLYFHKFTPNIVDENVPFIYIINNDETSFESRLEGEPLSLLFISAYLNGLYNDTMFPNARVFTMSKYIQGQNAGDPISELAGISFTFGEPTKWGFKIVNYMLNDVSALFEYEEHTSNPLYYTETVIPL